MFLSQIWLTLGLTSFSILQVTAVAIPADSESLVATGSGNATQIIKPSNPLIWYHGRWDQSPGTWWGGSGLKLHVKDLTSLTLNIGYEHTTWPYALVGLSVDYEPFRTVNISAGVNVLPLEAATAKPGHGPGKTSVVRLAVEGWQNNRIELESIELNKKAKLLPYKPSKLAFQVIGDSLSAGQYNTFGTLSSWGFLTAQNFKAESNINAQPGGCLTDIVCWGNYHGLSYQYFKTEDTGYWWAGDHNYTTDWDFRRDYAPTHLFIYIGANDNSFQVTGDAFVETYLGFVARLRKLYPHQPIFVLNAWGWPAPDGNVYGHWYVGKYEEIVEKRKALGDKNIYLIDTTGWIGYGDIYPDNSHPSDIGHQHVSEKLTAWLEDWGLKPRNEWGTLPDSD